MASRVILVLTRDRPPTGERVQLVPALKKPLGEILNVTQTVDGRFQVVASFDREGIEAVMRKIVIGVAFETGKEPEEIEAEIREKWGIND